MLVMIGRKGSIASAAAELGVTQQAVSSRLQRLEGLLGVVLVSRRTEGSVLTVEGRRVVELSSVVLNAAQNLDVGIGSLRVGSRARLTVAASLTVAEHFLPHWIVSLRSAQSSTGRQLTDVVVRATNTANAIRLVSTDAVELGFVEGAEPSTGLSYQRLASDKLVVVVAPSHEWARRTNRTVSPGELAGTALATREPGSGCREVFEAALYGAGIQPGFIVRPFVELPSNVAITEAVTDGVSPAVITWHAVRNRVGDGRLVQIDTPGLDLTHNLGAIWKGARRPGATAARELLSYCHSATGQDLGTLVGR
jgi:molybdate transport repressor ModE-like protein